MYRSKAGAIVSDIWNDGISDEDKIEAIRVVANEPMKSFNPTVRKEDLQEAFKWILRKHEYF